MSSPFGREFYLLFLIESLSKVSGQDETFDQCSEEVCRKAIPIPKAPGKMLTDRQQDVVFEIFAKNLEMCK